MDTVQTGGENTYINVSRGLINGASRLQKVGYSATITSAFQTIWNESTVISFPTTAAVLTVSSGSANDTLAGTGARTVTVTGLDINFNTVTEVVTLNGQTAVNTVNSYYRVNSLIVTSAGSGNTNAGVIYIGTGVVSTGKPATVYNSIGLGFNQSESAFTTIPASTTGYLLGLLASTDTAGTQIQLLVKTNGGAWRTNRIFQLGVGAGTSQQYQLPLALSAGTDIMAQATNAGSNVKVSCQFELLLISPL